MSEKNNIDSYLARPKDPRINAGGIFFTIEESKIEPEIDLIKDLIQLRNDAGLTKEELAEQAGIDIQCVEDIENRVRYPEANEMMNILNVICDDIFSFLHEQFVLSSRDDRVVKQIARTLNN